jgi:hypothetical protein
MGGEPGIGYRHRDPVTGKAGVGVKSQRSGQGAKRRLRVERPHPLDGLVEKLLAPSEQGDQQRLLHTGWATAVWPDPEGVSVRLVEQRLIE